MVKLTEEQIVAQLGRIPDWKREDEKWISRRYRFSTFPAGIRFVNEVADIAERMNHHPMIAIDYKMVTLRLTSWNSGGLTEADFASAEAYDKAFAQITDRPTS
jgi:4a-hydroxytetrahydrobiopterin dehydratase